VAALLLDAKVGLVADAMDAASIRYAFGGAIALAYYAAPRGTGDIDINVFVAAEEAAPCLEVFASLGVDVSELDPHALERQLTLHWGHTPIHVFFSYDPFHDSCRSRVRRVPFAGSEISILSAEDIVIFKLIYDRPKDRSEVREVLFCMGERMDVSYTLEWLDRLLSEDDQRLVGFRQAMDELRTASR